MKTLIKSISNLIAMLLINAIAILLINAIFSGLITIIGNKNFASIFHSNGMQLLCLFGYIIAIIISLFNFNEIK